MNLQHVAGVTVEDDQGEGSFLLVRGTSADLSNVQIDGVALATPQEDGRRVNLNVITVDQLERIELSKTWLPYQKPAVGGTIEMKTRSALDRGETFASLEVAGTYR
ncbi:MAG: TonB-dependent receptor plug domain-containing protein, partial [Pelovirga sp.]